jgi:sec-independent protein translocase protein TatA
VFQVGPLEIALVAIIALIVLGPAKLPDAARAMGKGMREFKGALSGEDDDRADDGVHETPRAPEPAPVAAQAAAPSPAASPPAPPAAPGPTA